MAVKNKKKCPVLPGMGSLIDSKGVGFRVWAPNAQKVEVLGDFNDWSEGDELSLEAEGYWYGFVEKAKPGQEYQYKIHTGDAVVQRIDPYARMLTNSAGNGLIYDPQAFDWEGDERLEIDRRNLVIYEMHLGTFAGSFAQAAEKLTYLQAIGINAIELMPVTDFPGELSWGYNPAHSFAVETNYGGADGLKSFVKEAHKRGIAVILDVVYNHLGPGDLAVWNFDGSDPEGGGVYFYPDERANTPWGDTRPNYELQPVRQYLRDNAMMWIEEYHIDGLRTDGTVYIRRDRSEHEGGCDLPHGWSLLQWICEDLHALSPRPLIIAEDLQANEWLTKPIEEGGTGFDAQWDGRLGGALREMLAAQDDIERSPGKVAELLTPHFNGDAFQSVIFTENHDEVANGKARLPEEIDSENTDSFWARARASLGAFIVLTTPGIPMLFQGQERFDDGWFQDDQPMDWSQGGRDQGILRLYRDLVRLRTGSDGQTLGLNGYGIEIVGCNEEEGWLAYRRFETESEHPGCLVLLQMRQNSVEIVLEGLIDGTWTAHFSSAQTLHGDAPQECGAPVECRKGIFQTVLSGYSVAVYSL